MRSRSKSLPRCPEKIYCGKYEKISMVEYDRKGLKEECFRKGMGVGMMIEFKKIKNKLEENGIILVPKQKKKVKCVDKRGKVKSMYSK